jgi:sensor histidine kinase YesM
MATIAIPKNYIRFFLNQIKVLLICGGIGIFATLLFNRAFYWKNIDFQVYYGMAIGYPLWQGNSLVAHFVAHRFPWNKSPFNTLFLVFTAGLIYSLIAIIIINYIWYNFWNPTPVSLIQLFNRGFYPMLSEVLITIIITLSHYVALFVKEWKKLLLREEQLKREALSLQFEALKNQVNPHFLFNSLNVLTSLVETDSQLAVRFIKQLSDVYRYVLENKDKELVDLKTELRFVKAFIYLQKIRFDNSLQVDISIPNTTANIIPLSLQMLVENAIKHNIVSSDQPLQIIIFTDDHYLVVRNNLQKKMVIKETGSIGLNNIRDRYIFFSTLPVIIEENEEWFTVKLPLIKK